MNLRGVQRAAKSLKFGLGAYQDLMGNSTKIEIAKTSMSLLSCVLGLPLQCTKIAASTKKIKLPKSKS